MDLLLVQAERLLGGVHGVLGLLADAAARVVAAGEVLRGLASLPLEVLALLGDEVLTLLGVVASLWRLASSARKRITYGSGGCRPGP